MELTAETLADLRYGVTAARAQLGRSDRAYPDEYAEAKIDELSDRKAQYAHELIEEHAACLDEYQLSRDLEGEAADDFGAEANTVPLPPRLVEGEIAKVSRELDELEEYRRKLIVYAHTVEVTRPNQSELSRLSGATRVTIARWLKDPELQSEVAAATKASVIRALKRHELVNPAGPDTLDDSAVTAARWILQTVDSRDSPPDDGAPFWS